MKSGFMGFDMKEHKVTMFNQGNDKWSTTKLDSIGLAVKNAMLIPEKTANKYIFVDSFTVSQSDVLASLERLTSQKWDVTQVNAEEQKKAGVEKMSKGDFSGAMSLIRYINCVDGHGGNYAEYEESANTLLSLPSQTLDEALKEVLEG